MAWRASQKVSATAEQGSAKKRAIEPSGAQVLVSVEAAPKASAAPASGKGGAKGGKGGKRGRQRRMAGSSGSLAELNARVESLEVTAGLHGKAILASADDLRDIKGLMLFTWAYADQTNELLEASRLEGVAYSKMIAEDKRAAEEEGVRFDPAKHGPASAHKFPAVLDKILELVVLETDKEAHAHFQELLGLKKELDDCMGPLEVSGIVGVFKTENAHGTTKKFVIKSNLSTKQERALNFFLGRKGFEVHLGKPPRNGLQRAVQGDLDQRS